MATKGKASTTTVPVTNGSLPKGWRMVRFGEVVRDVNEAERNPHDAGLERFVGLEHIEPQNLHLKEWGNLADGDISFTKRFRKGQVLFGKRRAYQRKVAVAEFDGICSSDILTFEPKDDALIPELLPFIVQSEGFFEHALGTSSGSLSPRTRWSQLQDYEFPLPPKDEQRRIADILWAVDHTSSHAMTVCRNLHKLHQAVLDTVFADQLATLPLGEALDYASDGPFGSKLKTEHYAKSGARVIRLQNVGDGVFDDSDRAFISEEYYAELNRYRVIAGDVIVAGLGDDTHPVGRAVIVPDSIGHAVNKADCFCLRAKSEVLLNSYLAYFLNSRCGREKVASKAQGTTRLRINVGNLKSVSIPTVPISQQRLACDQLLLIEDRLTKTTDWVRSLKSLYEGIINHLLKATL